MDILWYTSHIQMPLRKGSLKRALFVFTHYPTQNRYALLLEMFYRRKSMFDCMIHRQEAAGP